MMKNVGIFLISLAVIALAAGGMLKFTTGRTWGQVWSDALDLLRMLLG